MFLEGGNGRGSFSGGDLGRFGKEVARDIVLAEYVALGGDDALDARSDEGDEWEVSGGRVGGLDQHRGRGDEGGERVQAGGAHGFAGFCVYCAF